ncbi:uncharacterized protein LOC122040429 [Zingiber officinale]|uniref:DUF4408 domain-containing protein n=1 Tax=Zingiber officinale TaxID=94328 RepID=A0A8J5HWT1_ZINOF|nr:uncharacterized protein LOC122040429 [Zingiber officinale]KAG6526897.1 hypothetical protein ZIOFF_008984 [Zingiber officinale]
METDAIQAENQTAMRRYHRLRQIGTLLRYLEAAAAVLLLLSWSSARVPDAARLSADFLRHLVAVILSPRFVFLLGNAIVVLLLAESHRHSPSSSTSSSAGDMIYREFVESRAGGHLPRSLAPSSPEEVIYEDKEVCIEMPALRRSRSARMRRRRGATKGTDLTTEPDEAAQEEEDEEEFRRAVEAFIAKQTRFLREEEECKAAVFPTLSYPAGTPDRRGALA